MTGEERRAVMLTGGLLLVAGLVRVGWEARPVPPLLPPDTSAYAGLIEETERLVAEEERRNTPLAPGERVDPNRDPEVELARLPGVGPALAARIAAHRDDNGPFRHPEDLEAVSGIGPATVERIRDRLDLSDPPPGPGPVRGSGPTGRRLDVNRVGPDELETLPGIGPTVARRVVETRREMGGFAVVDDLLAVPGIGPATLERLRPLVGVR